MDWKDALAAARNNFEEVPELEESASSENTGISAQKGILHVITDKKGRNGKVATIIEGFSLPLSEVEDLARKLKQKLGVGGSVRNGEILIQGDHKESVKTFLKNLNFKVK